MSIPIFFQVPIVALVLVAPVQAQDTFTPVPHSATSRINAANPRDKETTISRAVRGQLKRAKVVTGSAKSDDDFFVVGKGERTAQGQITGVEFFVIHELERAHAEILDFLGQAPLGSVRDYAVWGRYKSAQEAEQSLDRCRQKFAVVQKRKQEALRLAMRENQRRQAEIYQERYYAAGGGMPSYGLQFPSSGGGRAAGGC